MNIKNNNNTGVINRILLLYLTDLTCFTEAEMEFFNKKNSEKVFKAHCQCATKPTMREYADTTVCRTNLSVCKTCLSAEVFQCYQ